VLQADEKTRESLRDYIGRRRANDGLTALPPTTGGDDGEALPNEPEAIENDHIYTRGIREIIARDAPNLVEIEDDG